MKIELCNCSHRSLLNNGFHKCGGNYLLNIPLYKYNNHTMIELNIIVDLEEDHIYATVSDVCNNKLYTPYYDKESSYNNKVCKIVKRKVKQSFKKLRTNNIIC